MPNDAATDRTPQKNTPDFDIFHPRDKGPWQKLGIAYTNRDGSISMLLEYVPVGAVDGRIRLQLRAHEARATDDGDTRAAVQTPAKPMTQAASRL